MRPPNRAPEILDAEGRNRLTLPAYLWSHAPRATNRNHIIVLDPGEAEGESLCGRGRLIRPRGEPVGSGTQPFNMCGDCAIVLLRAGDAEPVRPRNDVRRQGA